MGMQLNDNELQSMYDTVQDTLFSDTARIETSGAEIKYTAVPCMVSKVVTTLELSQSAGNYVYNITYKLSFPKYVDIDLEDFVYVLGAKLSVKTREFPRTNMYSKTITATFIEEDATYTSGVVAPYDAIWTTLYNLPLITSEGDLLII